MPHICLCANNNVLGTFKPALSEHHFSLISSKSLNKRLKVFYGLLEVDDCQAANIEVTIKWDQQTLAPKQLFQTLWQNLSRKFPCCCILRNPGADRRDGTKIRTCESLFGLRPILTICSWVSGDDVVTVSFLMCI